ncbi:MULTISPECIES: glycine cleavage system protein GcvH [Pandoraea]|uniref:Glycine cleavage system H protein n=5 Tax=Pandoraea TaxID=93217 RepID=A0A5E4THX6_9BURK|nr:MULTISPECIES: glycine cleavage system protein GcvH [Pandoraea]AJC15357.1 glycine cleavage system protein H [Pandoraea sputorum]AKC68769.1 glycine cleavage system protein H [Pandoraea oxalativorans]MCE4061496.1 glycine cleavage system protein GcvH [Pandoraea sputorum]UVA79391.1 glycine cleavage system protein GcvH [Pandoraea commovens]SNU90371.1 Glycine cleavage system H protein [Pandoraea sputorum]
MANIPDNLKYTESDEWARLEADGTVTVGITDFAQESLGDIVFVELPDVGRTVAADEASTVIESVKAAADVHSPVSGEILEVNEEVPGSPDLINGDAYGNWLFRVKPSNVAELDKLLDAGAYAKKIGA